MRMGALLGRLCTARMCKRATPSVRHGIRHPLMNNVHVCAQVEIAPTRKAVTLRHVVGLDRTWVLSNVSLQGLRTFRNNAGGLYNPDLDISFNVLNDDAGVSHAPERTPVCSV
jgi:hypothetical protein